MMIKFPHCTIEWDSTVGECITRFPDGTRAYAAPHNTDAYRAHARDKSTGMIDDYCWQHDCAHCVVGLMNGGPSVVLWNLAHDLPTDTPECEAEEQAAQQFQRDYMFGTWAE